MNQHNQDIQELRLKYLNFLGSQTDLYIKYYLILGKSLLSVAHINFSNIFDKKGNMEIGL